MGGSNDHQGPLEYHERPTPGKLTVQPTKPLATQRDLALAYSPGVAEASLAIAANPELAARYTVKGNLVGVVSNGTAVLGLGDIGPLAAKPVMEGKAVLFKKFAGIDVFDIELKEKDPERLADIIAALEPTFGAINLEDIKAPDCFIIEEKLRHGMNIPVFHDDQHGTAIVVGAAIYNGLEVVGKSIGDVRIVSTGGGAAGIACLDLLVGLGARPENIILVDHLGVVFEGRERDMTPQKARYATHTEKRTLAEVMPDADLFLGLSVGGLLTEAMVAAMAPRPLILALANPAPEIDPGLARKVRDDVVMATGRSDYPNQVNNVLCFPFIFRGALDVAATDINQEMKLAAVRALADLARFASTDVVAMTYSEEDLVFGPDYLIPKPFDPRLLTKIAPAVAKAAMDSGVATRPIEDFAAYEQQLNQFVYRSGLLMKPVFERARQASKRVVFAEGEDSRVLRAVREILTEGLATPILVGRPAVIAQRIEKLGLGLDPERDFEIVNPEQDDRYREYWTLYHSLMERKGVTPDDARTIARTNTTVIAALMVKRGEADAMICGTYGQYRWHLNYVLNVFGKRPGVETVASLVALIMSKGTFFLMDAYVNPDPTAAQLAEMTRLAAEEIRRFGITPKVALISHSNFGADDHSSAVKMREAVAMLMAMDPELEVEGEMHADAALDPEMRHRFFPNSRLTGAANLLVMPGLDTANTAMNLLRLLGDGLRVGPLLLGVAKPGHIVSPSVTTRGLINLTALAVVDALAADETGTARPGVRNGLG